MNWTERATGTFEVKMDRLALHDTEADPALARMSIDKQFRGDLDGSSRGEMLSAGTPVKGSAAYVAIEHVSGTLHGRRGTFTLQHDGVMTRGTPELVVRVVPDSGTDELAGLRGEMTIDISQGNHSYTLEYTLDIDQT